MAEICCNALAADGGEGSGSCDKSGHVARKRRIELRGVRSLPTTVVEADGGGKRRLLEVESDVGDLAPIRKERRLFDRCDPLLSSSIFPADVVQAPPRFGMTSICGRRRDMEDAIAIHPFFHGEIHYFGVYDGHGCSHVSSHCKERLHQLVKEELKSQEDERYEEHMRDVWWSNAMERSFSRMDKEVVDKSGNGSTLARCRCELKVPECDIVGSTAVVAVVTSTKIIVSNCGDSRAVLSRNGNTIPMSNDHKPDRPDELKRIESAGGRVIFWDGARVLGVLAMSRAIGDSYLKPYVISQPEVNITERTKEDEFLILASDGLWDVVSNETACGVARMCLMGRTAAGDEEDGSNMISRNKACVDASMLLTKLALSRRSADNISVVVVDLRMWK